MRNNKSKICAILGFFLILPLIFSPSTTSAATNMELQIQIDALLQQIQTLQTQLLERERETNPSFQFNFYRGLTDRETNGEVTKLQQLLSKYLQIYPEGLVTGYFGPLTEKAVQRYQERVGIADPNTKGYGVFGPKTRASVNKEIALKIPPASTVLPSSFPALVSPPPSPPAVSSAPPSPAATSTSPTSTTPTSPTTSNSPTTPPIIPISVVNPTILSPKLHGRTNSPPTITLSGIPSATTTLAVTASGTEITDASRVTNTQGDGLSNDSSFGIWEETTNLTLNGGCETNANGWINENRVAVARVTSQAKFGSASCEATLSSTGSDPQVGIRALDGSTRITISSSTVYTYSVWAKMRSNYGSRQLAIRVLHYDAGGANIDSQFGSDFSATTAYQRVTGTFRSPAGTATVRLIIYLHNGSGAQISEIYDLDGAQIEQKGFATPYTETDGATASRSAARIRASSTMIDETQGWMASRVRYGYSSSSSSTVASPYLLDWRDDANNLVGLSYATSTQKWAIERKNGGAGNTSVSAAQSFTSGASSTIIAAWTSSAIKISVDGGAFVSTADTNIPTLAATFFDIASQGGTTSHFGGDIFWFAAGTGTLTDADASTINGFGSTDSSYFPSTANTTFFWQADTTATSAAVTPVATASDYDGSVSQVVFTRTATNIVTDTSSPFTTTAILPIGTYTISGLATDNESATTRSASSTITVN